MIRAYSRWWAIAANAGAVLRWPACVSLRRKFVRSKKGAVTWISRSNETVLAPRRKVRQTGLPDRSASTRYSRRQIRHGSAAHRSRSSRAPAPPGTRIRSARLWSWRRDLDGCNATAARSRKCDQETWCGFRRGWSTGTARRRRPRWPISPSRSRSTAGTSTGWRRSATSSIESEFLVIRKREGWTVARISSAPGWGEDERQAAFHSRRLDVGRYAAERTRVMFALSFVGHEPQRTFRRQREAD